MDHSVRRRGPILDQLQWAHALGDFVVAAQLAEVQPDDAVAGRGGAGGDLPQVDVPQGVVLVQQIQVPVRPEQVFLELPPGTFQVPLEQLELRLVDPLLRLFVVVDVLPG